MDALLAAIDGLPAAERSTLDQCAIFGRSFALEAAEAVVDGVPSVLDALHELRDRSLLQVRREDRELQFSLPHTVRALIAERRPPDPALALRHRAWLAERTAALLPIVDGPRAEVGLAEPPLAAERSGGHRGSAGVADPGAGPAAGD